MQVLDKCLTSGTHFYGTPGPLELRCCSGTSDISKPTYVIFRGSHGNAIAKAWWKTMPSKVCKLKHQYKCENMLTDSRFLGFPFQSRYGLVELFKPPKLARPLSQPLHLLQTARANQGRETKHGQLFKVRGLMLLISADAFNIFAGLCWTQHCFP